VFRIIQESLANVAKHARASRVQVRLEQRSAELVLSVQDDGVGFQPAAPRKPQSLGLAGVRERAHLLRGQLDVDSAPGAGTRVHARIPLQEEGS
jgi:signal transduction histidine kinase